jgi:hypothetical protein
MSRLFTQPNHCPLPPQKLLNIMKWICTYEMERGWGLLDREEELIISQHASYQQMMISSNQAFIPIAVGPFLWFCVTLLSFHKWGEYSTATPFPIDRPNALKAAKIFTNYCTLYNALGKADQKWRATNPLEVLWLFIPFTAPEHLGQPKTSISHNHPNLFWKLQFPIWYVRQRFGRWGLLEILRRFVGRSILSAGGWLRLPPKYRSRRLHTAWIFLLKGSRRVT